MANELIVSTTDEGIRIALLENKKLVELHHEKRSNQFSVGDIYLGKVKKVLTGLNAVFVDIGYNRDAFLHYLDLGPQIRTQNRYLKSINASRSNITRLSKLHTEPDIDKHGKIGDVLKPGQMVLVQIMKEAISSKGPRLSSQLSIAGQYLILMPFSSDVSVSRKFKSNEERKRVRQYMEGICPANFGLIIRTAAEDIELTKLKDELGTLLEKWDAICNEIVDAKPNKKVYSEIDRASSIMRDMLSIGFDAIYVDDDDIYKDIEEYLQRNQPEKVKILQNRKVRGGLFELLGIERQIKTLFGKTVNLSNGAYLIVEHTEALHVFDVNSGSIRSNEDPPEKHALKINLEAAGEIARQLRLRDMGGIIVIDFIDQKDVENKKLIYDALREEMSRDRAKHTILPMSRFGLIQLTRQRVRPEVNIITDEVCPSCSGSGKIRPSILIIDEIQNNVAYLFQKTKIKKLKLQVNPFINSYLRIGFPSLRLRWFFKYGKWVRLLPAESLPFTAVRYFDENDEEIKLD